MYQGETKVIFNFFFNSYLLHYHQSVSRCASTFSAIKSMGGLPLVVPSVSGTGNLRVRQCFPSIFFEYCRKCGRTLSCKTMAPACNTNLWTQFFAYENTYPSPFVVVCVATWLHTKRILTIVSYDYHLL